MRVRESRILLPVGLYSVSHELVITLWDANLEVVEG